MVNGRGLHVRGSMGIARMESDVDGADHVLRNADLAMYRAAAAATSAMTPRCTPSWCSGCSRRPTCGGP